MKYIHYIILEIAVTCFLLASCGEKENIEQITVDKVSVDKTELTFTGKDESKTFSLFCMDEWHLEAESYVVDLKAVGKSNEAVIKLNAVAN